MVNIRKFLKDESGATAIEYGLIACRYFGCDHRDCDQSWWQAGNDLRQGVKRAELAVTAG
jgi:hypothetical protein